MKTHLTCWLLLAIIALLVSCKKDDKPIIPGHYYNLQIGQSEKDWHPVNPVYVQSIYFNPVGGMYCKCTAHFYGWPVLAPGVIFNPAKDSILVWDLPISELR